jgi:hypothetical protein
MKVVSKLFVMMLLGVALFAPVAKAGDQYGYNEGFFLSSADDDFSVKLNALFQGEYFGTILDGAAQPNTSTFNVPFARMFFGGHAFGPEWSYMLSFDMSGGFTFLDYYVNWMHCEALNVRIGNAKVPFGREFLTPEHLRQFADTSINTVALVGREVGVTFWGSLADKMVDYWIGVTNGRANGTGSGAAQVADNDIDFRYTARLTYHAMGHHGFTMSDMAMSEEPQLAISAGGYWNKLDTDANGSFDNTFGGSADVVYAMHGFSFFGEWLMFQAEAAAADVTNHGFLGQAGYFFNKETEFAARVAFLKPDVGGETIKPGAVLNWYLHGHNAKVQIQYDLAFRKDVTIGTATDDLADHSVIAQLQFFI